MGDLVKNLRENWPNMTDAYEAADEITRLRADLAAERELKQKYMRKAIDRRRERDADLAAEREAQRAGMRALGAAEDFNNELMAERDALRALLREAGDLIRCLDPRDAFKLRARIDRAVLDKIKGGGDE